MELLAPYYERFQASNQELCDVDKQFDVEFDQWEILAEKAAEAQREADRAMAQLSQTRNGHRTLEKCVR